MSRTITSDEVRSGSTEALAWIEESKRAQRLGDSLSFMKDPRCRPGALIEVRGVDAKGDLVTRTLLIGDINPEGGTCGCCCEVLDEDCVLRVKNLLEE